MARARTAPVVEEQQEVRAQAKWLRIAPRKARLVVEHIRGRTVPEARTVLAFTPRAAAREIEKVLASAVANAEANHGLIGDELVVAAAYVDEGPTIKRWRARARGRATRIKKHTCHVTIRLVPGETDTQTRRPRREQAEAAPEPETKPEEKPKRAPRKRTTTTTAKAAADKPKPKRAPRKKKEEETTT
jgi:large subunit ribosomal protein L22